MHDSKVAAITEAARKRFAHYGLSKTTMNEIAADIGMSKAALYYYFPDKERIFIAVVEEEMDEFVKAIEQLIERTSKPSFKLKKFVALRNQLLSRMGNLGNIESPRPEEYFNPVFDDLRATYTEREKGLVQRILQRGIDEGEFTKFPVVPYTDLFLAALSGIRLQYMIRGKAATATDNANTEEQTRLLVDIFLRSIAAESYS